jgi:peptidyl-prolyl cis-trans isomerase SurA
MDAAKPLCRWLFAFGLAAAIGCKSYERLPFPTIRGQAPAAEPVAPVPPPGPLSPLSPSGSSLPVGRVVPAAPTGPGSVVQGQPIDPNIKGASGITPLPAAAKAVDLMKESVPQIKVVALIGASHLVTDQEVIEAVRQRLFEILELSGPARSAKEKELYAAELRRIIERELILDDMYAKLKKQGRLGLADEIKEFAEKAADQILRGMRKERSINSDDEFRSMLRTQGLTEPVIRRQIERQIMADEYVRSAIKEKGRTPGLADIRAYYEQHQDEFKSPDRVKWLDIFISFNKHATPQAARTHAAHVRSLAVPSKVQREFVELVKEYDNGLAIGTGGVGVGSKRGEIQPAEVEPVLWSLKPGQVSDLIETATGFHIVKVAERDYAGVQVFDVKVQNAIREKLLRQYREEEYKKLVEELWRKGGVRVIDAP